MTIADFLSLFYGGVICINKRINRINRVYGRGFVPLPNLLSEENYEYKAI